MDTFAKTSDYLEKNTTLVASFLFHSITGEGKRVTMYKHLCFIYIVPFNPPTSRVWQPTPVLLPAKSHGRRSLVGCTPWGRLESDMTERLHFHFSLSCTGEGNGNPLQCSCLENPRDGGAWWAAVYGVAQSRTRLKRLSNSSILDLQYCVSFRCKAN